jgi:hypothetical protein
VSDPITTRSQVMKSLATVFGFEVDEADAKLFIDEMGKRGLLVVDAYDSGGMLPPPRPRLSHMRASLAVSPDASPDDGGEEKS